MADQQAEDKKEVQSFLEEIAFDSAEEAAAKFEAKIGDRGSIQISGSTVTVTIGSAEGTMSPQLGELPWEPKE